MSERLLPLSACALLAALHACGCVQRTIEVITYPPGARVYVDREYKGVSPLEVPFHFYGRREVAVEMDGYVRQSQARTLLPPWYEVFPLDFIFDCLLPLPINDRRVFEFRLERAGRSAEGRDELVKELNDRAEKAREDARQWRE